MNLAAESRLSFSMVIDSIFGYVIVSQIIGALLGDFLVGNKNLMIVGGVLQIVGTFAISLGTKSAIFLGVIAIVTGTGFFISNLRANYAKNYLSSPKSIDSGFMILIISSNLGAFLGAFLISLSAYYNFYLGLAICATIYGVSTFLVLYSTNFRNTNLKVFSAVNARKRTLLIFGILILNGIFLVFSTMGSRSSNDKIYDAINYEGLVENIGVRSVSSYLPGMAIFVGGILLSIVWHNRKSERFIKLAVGLILTALGFVIVLALPSSAANELLNGVQFVSLILIALGGIYISPIINSIVSLNTNPKYLAIVLVGVSTFSKVIAYLLLGVLNIHNYSLFIGDNSQLLGCTIFIVLIAVIAFIYHRRQYENNSA